MSVARTHKVRQICDILRPFLGNHTIEIEAVGWRIFQGCRELDDKQQEEPWPGGPLWKGHRGFYTGRWEFWQERFLELSDESSLGEED